LVVIVYLVYYYWLLIYNQLPKYQCYVFYWLENELKCSR
jgi:hypothetical protein